MEQRWLGLCLQNLAYCVDCNNFNPYNFHNFYTVIHFDKMYCIFKSQSLKYNRTYGQSWPFWPILTNFSDNYRYIGYRGFDIVFNSLGPFKIYQLISTANPASFGWNRPGLVVPISWYIDPKQPPGFENNLNGIIFCHHFYVKSINPFSHLIFCLQLLW